VTGLVWSLNTGHEHEPRGTLVAASLVT